MNDENAPPTSRSASWSTFGIVVRSAILGALITAAAWILVDVAFEVFD
jgi:hypothetical protein